MDDGTSGVPGAIDTWNGYSAAGEATGEVIYANYGAFPPSLFPLQNGIFECVSYHVDGSGREEDYAALDDMGVNLTGKIVLVRYRFLSLISLHLLCGFFLCAYLLFLTDDDCWCGYFCDLVMGRSTEATKSPSLSTEVRLASSSMSTLETLVT